MLTYEPGDTLAYRLNPRTKLTAQVAFVVTGFAHTTPAGLVALGVVAAGYLRAADASPVSALRDPRYAIPLLALGPVVEATCLGASWFDLEAAVEPMLTSIRMLLVFFVTTAYVRTTPVRESRATIRLPVPGQFGVTLGVGVVLVFRFFPLIRRNLHRIHEAQATRLGSERWLDERLPLVAVAGLRRSFTRTNVLTLALRTRCFAWNPTLPEVRFGRRNAPGLVLVAALLVSLAP